MIPELPVLTAASPTEKIGGVTRIGRLARVRDVLRSRRIQGVLRLHDHKGWLSVWWADTPSEAGMVAICDAWAAENEETIQSYTATGFVWPANHRMRQWKIDVFEEPITAGAANLLASGSGNHMKSAEPK